MVCLADEVRLVECTAAGTSAAEATERRSGLGANKESEYDGGHRELHRWLRRYARQRVGSEYLLLAFFLYLSWR